MSRRVSINARTAHDAGSTDEVEVVLVRIVHPGAPGEVIRLSTDPTHTISVDPLVYGTRSPWLTENPAADPYLFVLADTVLPEDKEDAPHSARLILSLVDSAMVALLRSTWQRARVDIAVVLASSPDLVEAEWLDLRLTGAEGDTGEVTLTLSRDPLTEEPWPAPRMTRQRFPGLHP